MPEVSVVVPTHNRSAWLRLTLASVLSQRNVDIEIIVVDDGSTDDTAKTVASLTDSRVRLLRHERALGVAVARNHGAAEARGDWLGFIDDDDLWAPEKLTRQLEVAAAGGRTWIYSGSVNVDNELRVLAAVRPPPPPDVARLVPRRNVIPGGGSNVIVRREAFERVGTFDPRLRNTEDWEMWIRLARDGPPDWVPEPLLAYRVHSSNASLDIDEIFAGVALIERQYETRADRGVLHRWIAESCLRTSQRALSLKHLGLAALHGQARNVTGDVLAILRRRVRRGLRLHGTSLDHPVDDDWNRRAQQWVDGVARRASEAG